MRKYSIKSDSSLDCYHDRDNGTGRQLGELQSGASS